MGGQASRPVSSDEGLDRILDALRRFSADHLDHRLEEDPASAYATLTTELNRMAGELQRRRDEVVRAVELYCLHRFGSVLVHDLKNLAARLTFVPGNLRGSEGDGEVLEACATTVEDTVSRLEALVRRFRDQREAMVLKAHADINQVLEAAIEHSGVRASSHIRTDVSLQELPRIEVDAPYLEEALVNILRNAVEAMKEGGTLRVRSHRVDDPAPFAILEITDDGPGMTPEFVERDLFTPFRSTKERGLGLGMFSCRETVELHGGRIVVESSPGHGTTFQVHLPLASAE